MEQFLGVVRREGDALAAAFVGDAYLDFLERVEAVEIGDGEFVDAIDDTRVAGRDRVEPAAAGQRAGLRPVVEPNSRPIA